jgi:pyrroloquinoline quinone (PQQ) biosynthesis protein C
VSKSNERIPSDAEIEAALEVLLKLSERSEYGKLRDAIATVRSALWDMLDRGRIDDKR